MQDKPEQLIYHSKCYRYYTAVKRSAPEQSAGSSEPSEKVGRPETRCRSTLPTTGERSLLKGSCIFYKVQRRSVNGNRESLSDCLTSDGTNTIFEAAEKSSNDRIKSLARGQVDLIASEAQYHKSCRRAFFKEVQNADRKRSDESSSRQLHTSTFRTISAFIETEVICNRQSILLASPYDLYRVEYLNGGGTEEDIETYNSQNLSRKIKEAFGSQICIVMFTKRQGNFIYPSTLSEIDARASLDENQEKCKLYNMIRTVALHFAFKSNHCRSGKHQYQQQFKPSRNHHQKFLRKSCCFSKL